MELFGHGSYCRSGATGDADLYWQTPNWNSPYDDPNDCTNFISQTLLYRVDEQRCISYMEASLSQGDPN
jgi:hypothetical protein